MKMNIHTLNPLLIIPARLNSTRLPRKVLADINGKPMIAHVYERCVASNIGPVLVACDSAEIAWEIEKIGGKACLTDPDLPSGSDRIYAALKNYDPERYYNVVICIQADLPLLEPNLIKKSMTPLLNPQVDIATLATLITSDSEANNLNVVKIALASNPHHPCYQALYFSRAAIPFGEGPKYHHIGLYAYKRLALEYFVSLTPSPLEISEKLEQLRALEAGMRIDVSLVNTNPLGVDTAHDLELARAHFK